MEERPIRSEQGRVFAGSQEKKLNLDDRERRECRVSAWLLQCGRSHHCSSPVGEQQGAN